MAEEQAPETITRIFEQPPDSVSFYADLSQVIGTGHEILLQLYETIPGPPGPTGTITQVKSRLRATITIGMLHARNLGQLLVQRADEAAAAAAAGAAPPAAVPAEEATEEEATQEESE